MISQKRVYNVEPSNFWRSEYFFGTPLSQMTLSGRRGLETVSLCRCWASLSFAVFLAQLFLIFLLTNFNRNLNVNVFICYMCNNIYDVINYTTTDKTNIWKNSC